MAHARGLPAVSLSLLSAATLAYEILLMQLFSLVQWHHFAYMIISVALLGFGASGAILSLTERYWRARVPALYLVNLFAFSLASAACGWAAQAQTFNAEALLWDLAEWRRLFLVYALLMLPFWFSANALALALAHYRDDVPRLYAVNLLGAGVGSAGAILLMFLAAPLPALASIALVGGVAALIALRELRLHTRPLIIAAGAASIAIAAVFTALSEPAISPYKPLSQTLRVAGTEIVAERTSPLGTLSVVESSRVPLRHAPGLSLRAESGPPAQVALFINADAMTVITQDSGERERLRYLDQMTSALPYYLGPLRKVLVLGAGGGAEVLQARYHGATDITAVELNPHIVALLRGPYREYAGRVYDRPEVKIEIAEARGFASTDAARYDLVQIAPLDSFGAAGAGLYALSESYVYTTEALTAYQRRLAPGGYLALTRWVQLPPRDALKLFATAAASLETLGKDAARHLFLIRGWQTATLIVKNGAITGDEIARLKRFCRERAFDLVYYPGITESETNRYNQLSEPVFYRAAQALIGEGRERLLADYKFDLRPATDDRPYFFHFLKWRTLPELLAMRERGGLALIEWGYIVLLATLAQAILAGALLILLPLAVVARRAAVPNRTLPRALIYFGAVGLAFLLLEIAFIQKLVLLLHHPIYAVAATLSAFLIFAGIGSRYAQRAAAEAREAGTTRIAVLALAALAFLYIAALDALIALVAAAPTAVRFVIAIALIAPLAFFMGMPFALGLSRLQRAAPSVVPWAFGVNGCASVIAAVSAALLAVHAGFTVVLLTAVSLYAIAAASFPGVNAANLDRA